MSLSPSYWVTPNGLCALKRSRPLPSTQEARPRGGITHVRPDREGRCELGRLCPGLKCDSWSHALLSQAGLRPVLARVSCERQEVGRKVELRDTSCGH